MIVRLSGVPVHLLIFYSSVVALVLQAAILSMKDFRQEIPPRKMLKYPVFLGLVGLVNTFSYYYAFQNTTIANAVLTHYTAPVIVAFMAPLFLREAVTKRIIGAIAISSAGLWLMLNGFSLRDGHAAGLLAGLVSGFAYAVVIILARVYTQGISPLALTFMANAVVAVALAPFVREVPFHAFGVFVLMGVVQSTMAPFLYYKGLRYVTANRAAVLGYLEPVSAIIFSMIFLNELPGMHSVAGGMLIIFSGYLTLTGER